MRNPKANQHGKVPVDNTPMPAAPMRYNDDGSVAWDSMWDSFCALAIDGGPPHRGTVLQPAPLPPDSPSHAIADYDRVVAEIVRGIALVSGLSAYAAKPGWVGVMCESAGMACWLAEAINAENVQASYEGKTLFVPAGDAWETKYEIKNVVTAVAKTTHYWQAHVQNELKQTLELEATISHAWKKIRTAINPRAT